VKDLSIEVASAGNVETSSVPVHQAPPVGKAGGDVGLGIGQCVDGDRAAKPRLTIALLKPLTVRRGQRCECRGAKHIDDRRDGERDDPAPSSDRPDDQRENPQNDGGNGICVFHNEVRFMSLCALTPAVVPSRMAAPVDARSISFELPAGKLQPVLLMPGRSVVLEINVDLRMRFERDRRTRAAYRIAATMYPDHVCDRERPEGARPAELPSGEMQEVSVAADQRSTTLIPSGRPVRGLEHIDNGNAFARGRPTRDPAAWLATPAMLLQPLIVVVTGPAAAFENRRRKTASAWRR